ncbi:DNAJ heat shock N-terminal domain-containing protein [Artemisia annua]|uniref:DNAJ heat shock N-terminal domain-containing protein n=1 Tax=Artemisia annua TaxID=35608 RepID=A0A2U1MK78_ARTAN|nr:DNAJ heat shock N-terminal domain-containing protein [Artemisia annua]
MQLANNTISQTHYSVLNVKEDASHEEIRTGYKSALLISHPDKLQKPTPTADSNHNEPQSRFLEIQTAWEILGDVKSRALYDMELRVSRQEDVIADEVELDDMIVEANGDVVELFYQCRCGDYFSLDSLELREMGFQLLLEGDKFLLQTHNSVDMTSIVLPCGSCSLKIRLIINKDTQP